jgi:hypothetical protein
MSADRLLSEGKEPRFEPAWMVQRRRVVQEHFRTSESRRAHAEHIAPDLRPWNILRLVGARRSSLVGKFEYPPRGAEDSSRRNELEETLGNLREFLRHRDLVPGHRRPANHSEARRSQGETHGEQTPFAQHPHRSRCRRRSGDRDRCGVIPTMLAFAVFLYSTYW